MSNLSQEEKKVKVKRIFATFGTCFDQFVTKMENHEALASCVIEDFQKSAAHVRSEKNRVDARLKKIEDDKAELSLQEALWRNRAKSCVDTDDKKAMTCLTQANAIVKRLNSLDEQHSQIKTVSNDLRENLREIESKLEDLKSRRSLLSSRQARAKAIGKVNDTCENFDGESIFERWEKEIIIKEYKDPLVFARGDEHPVDETLSREFETIEETEFLRAELEALRAEKNLEVGVQDNGK